MKLFFFATQPQSLVLQAILIKRKERKLQYQWYHNFRSYLVRVARLVCIFFPEGRKQRCCRRPAVGKRLSTGQSHLIVRVSLHTYKKCYKPQKRFIAFWSEWRDSNSRHPGPKPGALPTGPHPDIKLRENARCGQICGQGNSSTLLTNFQRR